MVSHLWAHRTECESRDSADEIVQCDVCRSARTADRVIFHPVNLNEKLHPEPPRGWPRGPKYHISASPRRLRNRQHTKQEQRIMQHVSRQRLVIGKLRQRLSRHRDDILAFTQVEHRGPPIRERRQLLEHAIGNLGRQLVQRLPLPAE